MAATMPNIANGLSAVLSRTRLVVSAQSCCALPRNSRAFPDIWVAVANHVAYRGLNLACCFFQRTFCCVGVHDVLPLVTLFSLAREVPAATATRCRFRAWRTPIERRFGSRTAAHQLPQCGQRTARGVFEHVVTACCSEERCSASLLSRLRGPENPPNTLP